MQTTYQYLYHEAELSKGTLYLYFQNKDELCQAIVLRSLTLIKKLFKNVLTSDLSGEKKLQLLPGIYLEFTRENPLYYQALLKFRNYMLTKNESTESYENCLKENREVISIIISIIEAGISDGSIVSDAEPKKIALIIWGERTGFLPGLILGNLESLEPDIKVDEVVQYFMRLINKAIAE